MSFVASRLGTQNLTGLPLFYSLRVGQHLEAPLEFLRCLLAKPLNCKFRTKPHSLAFQVLHGQAPETSQVSASALQHVLCSSH